MSRPKRDTDLRAVYPVEPDEVQELAIRLNRPSLWEISGWDAETVAKMKAQIIQAEGEPSFLDAAEAAVRSR